MRRHVILFLCATGLFVSLDTRPVHAEAIHFNTDNGVMTIDGVATNNFFGTPMQPR